jgi:hypothetical protein
MISQHTGIIYLGDTPEGDSTYIIPERISGTRVFAADASGLIADWDGTPFALNTTGKDISFETGIKDWTFNFYLYPEEGICMVSDPFSGVQIPYGTVQKVKAAYLGDLRDLSTVTGKVSDLFPDRSFQEILRGSPELDQSNQSLKDWTNEINITNKTISDSLGDLFDDIKIQMPEWKGRLTKVCIQGRVIRSGTLDIRAIKEDPSSSFLYATGQIKEGACTELMLNEQYPEGDTAYIVLIGEGNVLLSDLQIILPKQL